MVIGRSPRPAGPFAAPASAARRVVAGLALLAASPLAAQMVSIPLGGPPKVRPSPNAALLGAPADIVDAVAARGRSPTMRALDGSSHPVEVLTYLGLTRGLRVLVVERDLGYFGAIIGAAVGPGGRVTELIPPAAMQDPATRATLSDDISLAPALSLLAASPATVRLPPAGFDFVLLHRAGDRLPVAGTLFAAVRPGGIVGVVDGATDDGDPGDAGGDPAAIKRDFARAGFVLDNEGRIRGGDASVDAAPGPAIDRRGVILKFRKPE